MRTLFRVFISQIKANKLNGSSLVHLKYFLSWSKSQNPNSSSVKDEQPWITFDVINFLQNKLNSKSIVFEYGGGGSTLFFVKRAEYVFTAEHNKEWFKILTKLIEEKKINNWSGNFIEAEKENIVPNPDIANPEHYSSDDIPSKDFNYKKYASFIDDYSDSYFDFVLVDGRSRPACIQHSIPKIKRGGYLILDNSDREYYLMFFKEILLKQFKIIIDNTGPSPYTKEFTKTSVWQKK